jgi:two-component system, response regulator RegA
LPECHGPAREPGRVPSEGPGAGCSYGATCGGCGEPPAALVGLTTSVDRSWFFIIDPEPSGERLADALRKMKLRVDLSPSVQEVLSRLQPLPERPAVILLETRVQEGQGVRLLPSLREASPRTRFLVITAYGSIASAVQAVRLGAENYLSKPVSADMVLHVLGGELAQPGAADRVYPSLNRAIWEYIQFVLVEEGTVAGAARRLGVQPRSLRRMLQKHPPAR